jgi:hypothetical protein
VHGHREPLPDLAAEVVRVDHPERAVGDGDHGVDVAGALLGGHERLGGAGVDTALVGPGDLDVGALDPPPHRQGAGQQHEEAGRLLALREHGVTTPPGLHATPLAQPVQLVRVEGLEEEERAELVGAEPRLARAHGLVGGGSGHVSSYCSAR